MIRAAVLRFHDAERRLDLGVHDLIEAGPPAGHLTLQVAWSARARMRAGQQVHTAWQDERASEDAEFEREVSIKHRMVVRGWEVNISGRIDGMSQEGGRRVVEEVKSTALPVGRMGDPTWQDFPAWARQVQLYLWFLAGKGWTDTVGRLILISLGDGSQRVLHVPPDPDLSAWMHAQLDYVLRRREVRMAWLARRAASPVPFAHPSFRPGQDALSEDLTEALYGNRTVLLSAPTGYGKTAASLHAALIVAAKTGRRVFFATARTTQQRMAEEAVQAMSNRGLPIRGVSIRAKEKACLNDVVLCRPDACPYAEGYHDKVGQGDLVERAWREAQGAPGVPAPDEVIALGAAARACPFALNMDLVAEADLVIGDLNYVFDPGVRLSAIHDDLSDWIVVVDEAHNLPDRAIGYGSPELRLADLEAGVDALADSPIAHRYRACREALEDLAEQVRAGLALVPDDARDGEAAFSIREGLDVRSMRALAERFEALALEYALLRLDHPVAAPGEPDPWMDAARAVGRLKSALERAGAETVVIWQRGRARGSRGWGRTRRAPRSDDRQVALLGAPRRIDTATHPDAGLKLLCRDPAKLLGPVFDGLAGAICMSATLQPPDFYQAMFGVDPDRTTRIDHPSPFPPEHRRVVLLPEVSTEYRRRDQDRSETARLVSEAVRAVPGNVAVYFPSFQFLELLQPLLDLGDRPVLVQHRAMPEDARTALLDTMGRGEGHALLAVLGGIFAEGIDLPGSSLLAAVVVGPALPMANLERRLMQEWFQERYEEGFRYAWLVPGMSRVVQAAGRVIRTPTDKGAVVLVGRRFLLRDYQALFPDDWSPQRSRDPAGALRGLWG